MSEKVLSDNNYRRHLVNSDRSIVAILRSFSCNGTFYFLFWFLVGLVFAVRTISFSQQEDMGFFLSEAALISRGHSLYSDIFELKDPLFLWFSGISFTLINKSGPYLFDALLVALSAPTAFFTAKRLGAQKYLCVLSAVLFTGALSGSYYNTFRSGIAALFLVVVCFYLAARRNHFLLGMTCVAVIGFKMPYAPVLIGPLLISIWRQPFKSWLRLLLGSALTSITMFLVLLFRGELSGYLYMIQYNFRYRSEFNEVVGLPAGLSGRLTIIESHGSNIIWLLLIVIVITATLAAATRGNDRVLILGLGASQLMILMILASSAMWHHHMQPLALLLWAFGVSLGVAMKSCPPVKRSVALGILLLPVVMQLSGWRFPNQSATPLSKVLNPSWITPPEANFVSQNLPNLNLKPDFARLGNVDDLGLVAFLPDDWNLVCRQYGQGGSESLADVAELTDCLIKNPNYVFVSPGFFSLERATGNYGLLKNEVKAVLSNEFFCQDISDRPGAQFCRRINKSSQSN